MLVGKTITLSALQDGDKYILFRWINDPALMKWNAPFRPVSLDEHLSWFSQVRADKSKALFGIRRIANGQLIGLIQLVDIHPVHRSAELRIKICVPDCRGKGYGSEALRLLLDFARGTLNLRRVKAEVVASNAAALRTFERIGFQEEGRQREAAFMNGQWQDLVIMGLPLEGRSASEDDRKEWTDFTEEAYSELIKLAKSENYLFALFSEEVKQRHVLWRHDIDLSVHRAIRLAEIEAELKVRATYFVNPHCVYYNMLEPEILGLLRLITSFGHEIGLHFDADAYPNEVWTRESLESHLSQERMLVQQALGCPVEAFSYHNPDVGELIALDGDRLAGMVNAYSKRLRTDYVYASDSNGYWRFKPIPDVIQERHNRLHILTHPEWWTPDPLPPRDRIERCVMGRAQASLQKYDTGLARFGRRNIGNSEDRS